MPSTVDDYLRGLRGWQAEVARDLRDHILAAGGISEALKWAQPVYESGGPVCWIKAHKAHVTFGFWRGASLRHIEPRLEGSGSKMGHIKLRAPGEISADAVRRLVEAAVKLNQRLGDPTRGA